MFKHLLSPSYFKPFIALLISCCWFWSSVVFAFDFQVKEIKVVGNQRISYETIHSYLPVEIGDDVDDEKVKKIIHDLYQTHFFSDVQVYHQEPATLIIQIAERPAIAEISMEGNELISQEDMKTALEQLGIKKGRILDQLTLDRVVLDLKRRYQNQGYYGAEVSIKVTPLPRNRVALKLMVVEGKPATIGRITLVGNHYFTDDKIKSRLLLSEHSWSGGGDKYAKPKLEADLETIRSMYMDNGFARFKIRSSQVSLSLDYTQVFVTINLEEGLQYHIAQVKFSGETVLKPAQLNTIVDIQPGELYSRKKIIGALNRIRDRLSEEGYAFAEVDPLIKYDDQKKTVVIDFRIEPKDRVYVRKILIENNTRTQDPVIRREMQQFESAPYSLKAVRDSKRRLERLGYFKTVKVETRRVSSNQVDLVVNVEEQPTGSFMAGITYSQVDGAGFNLGLSERNLLGTGHSLDLKANYSSSTKSFNFNLTDPYFTPEGVSLGYGLFYNQVDASQLGVADYTTNTFGGDINLSYPTSEYTRLNYSLSLQDQELICSDTFTVCTNHVANYGKHASSATVSMGWRYDDKNGFYFPTKGQSSAINVAVTPYLKKDVGFYKLYFDEKWYHPVSSAITFKFKLSLAYGDGFGQFKRLPFYEHFYAGGIGSVRGFGPNSLGPQYDSATDGSSSPAGGDFKAASTFALVSPMPFIEDSSNMRISLFMDIGNVYATLDKASVESLRSSVGVGFSWITPVGPLSFSFARPVGYSDADDLQTFQFVLGVPL